MNNHHPLNLIHATPATYAGRTFTSANGTPVSVRGYLPRAGRYIVHTGHDVHTMPRATVENAIWLSPENQGAKRAHRACFEIWKASQPPRTIRDIITAPDFHPFASSSDAWIDDPDRMQRCHNAAEHGADGSTHAEIIEDWREYARRKYADARQALDYDDAAGEARLDVAEATLDAEIDACERYHEAAGTLHKCTGGEDPDVYRDAEEAEEEEEEEE